MQERFPNFIIFLFALQVMLTFALGGLSSDVINIHLALLATTIAYFAVCVFAIPKMPVVPLVRFDVLFGNSLLPFLQVTAADMWLIARAVHVWHPAAAVGLMIVLASLVLL